MSTVVSIEPCIENIEVTKETITAHLEDGRIISVPQRGRDAIWHSAKQPKKFEKKSA